MREVIGLIVIAMRCLHWQLPIRREFDMRGYDSKATLRRMACVLALLAGSVSTALAQPATLRLGYGTAAEVGCAGIPAVLLDRPDWPEQRYVVDWLHAHGRCLMVPTIQAVTAAALRAGMALPVPASPRPTPGGETEVAAAVLSVAGGGAV